MKTLFNLLGLLLGIFIVAIGVTMLCVFNGSITYEPNILENTIIQPVGTAGANVYFIKSDQGYIMVDTGMPCNKKDVSEIFEKVVTSPTGVKLIIVTHGHMDNMGFLGYAKKVSGAKILTSGPVAEKLRNGETEPMTAHDNFGKFLNIAYKIKDLIGKSGIDAIEPDIVMENEFDLSEYGITGSVISTPGHTAGSVSVILGTGEAIIGDLVTDEGDGVIGAGRFYENNKELMASLKKVAGKEPGIIYLAHGGWIDNNTLKLAGEQLKEKWADEL
jgi:hydroxyacylglutathione hydrolase